MVTKFIAKPELASLSIKFRDEHNISIFIETGTLGGQTTRWASEHFDTVYTIEKNPVTAKNAKKKLADCTNIVTICGDSRQELPKLLKSIGNKVALLFLDAHLTGPGATDECALREELRALVKYPQHYIFIDDAGWFVTGKPPAAVDDKQWLEYAEIEKILKDWDISLWRGVNVITAIPKERHGKG